ncbi:COX15/CtaA family protein [Longimicrobium terrae]|uniref:Heme A synthase n=1 Tax=Longimicrobium terrae TaxID=1639882 RepID=A0A841GQC1_9BACT|nr:COX15/CtaA family protein [Longimicrobium terrae]MBB4634835.1 heme A synthase [Longimicrobium terrae]MBB6069230.1 heme A synthase [Longimicrobium terrae]NNC31960.1 heme A synthase [Longimicrobium terrae]
MTADLSARRGFARYTWLVLAYTVAVVLWGAVVRATGSGAGCGSHWPACNGQVVLRAPSLETLIEFTHRATSGILGPMVIAMVWMAWRRFPKGHPARAGAVASLILTLTEGAVGAALVKLELVAHNASVWRAAAMAVHLTNTFLLLGALALTGWWASGRPAVRLRGQGAAGALMISAVVLTILVGAMGAVTALGDTLFPKTSMGFELSAVHFLERLRVVHPIAAIGTGIFVALSGRMVRRLRPGRETERLSTALVALFGLQVMAGTVNVVLLVPVWMQLVHLLLADALWITLVLTAASVLAAEPRAEAAPLPEPASPRPAAV